MSGDLNTDATFEELCNAKKNFGTFLAENGLYTQPEVQEIVVIMNKASAGIISQENAKQILRRKKEGMNFVHPNLVGNVATLIDGVINTLSGAKVIKK